MLEHSDVVVGHVPIGHGTHLAVAEVIAGQQVVIIEVELCAIRCHRFAISPDLRQIKLQIEFHQLAVSLVQLLQ